ncbi:MAG: SMP-30/gluconolactonase/LRE family protein [Azospirillum sp.]|nr:SMP-30/gluconolactonase/LRE family protein [Azospirillum sp.]
MFPPPPIKESRLFAKLPPELDLSGSGRRSLWLEDRPVHGRALGSFLEGPAFDREGTLFCVDIAYGRIFRIDGDGRFSVALGYDGAPNGLQIHRDGRFFIADHRRGLLAASPGDAGPVTILGSAFGDGFRGLNDLVFSRDGDLYFTDQGQSGLQDPSGRLFRLNRAGKLTLLLGGIPSPNGLVLNRDESCLFLAVTRANAIWRVPLGRQGNVTKVGVFLQLSGGGGPDGLAMDEADNLFVASPVLGCVWGFSAIGEPIWRIPSCVSGRSGSQGRMVTNLAFGGPDRRTLFMTESTTGSILTAELEVPGAALFSHLQD